MNYEFSYSYREGENEIQVAVNTDTYNKTLTFAHDLAEKLKEAISFPYRIVRPFTVHILSGDRRKGMLSVEMIIAPNDVETEAIAVLEEKGFTRGLEPYFG